MVSTIRQIIEADLPRSVAARLKGRSIVFIGLMGAGKTAIGRRAAHELWLPFSDSDHEIEHVSRMTIPELFDEYGEAEFRSLERRVIARLLKSRPGVISMGGGAFMDDATRRAIGEKGISVWLKADIETLMSRVMRKRNRPLLKNDNPRAVMEELIRKRYPVYSDADVTITTCSERKEVITAEVIEAIAGYLHCSEQHS